ncbi:Probable CCR4-associated factor 1 homolog 11 [Linum grandiflorum]
MNTDFPGTVMEKTGYEWKSATPTAKYECYKANVDCLKLIQVGLTLADQDGNLLDLGDESYCYIWEFNFRDFDEQNDHCNPTSINLLRQAGIVFKDLREK